MSGLDETFSENAGVVGVPQPGFINGLITTLSSVRFGIYLLIILTVLSLAGMLIMQQNVSGFESYYSDLSPVTKAILGDLGLFDVYRTWYFKSLLGLLALNIVLASLDRFPKTWKFVSEPKTCVSRAWLSGQKTAVTLESRIDRSSTIGLVTDSLDREGWKQQTVTKGQDSTVIFAETGAWNRLGAYPVHASLLIILLAGFLTSQFGYTGKMPLSPGQASTHISEMVFDTDQMRSATTQLPFAVTCTDIEQRLIDPRGTLETGNTLDWVTRLKVTDETGSREAAVQINRPFDYRGYRFFHDGVLAMGKARSVSLRTKGGPSLPQTVTIPRNGTVELEDGTNIRFVDFRANFSMAKEILNENSTEYRKPAAVLEVTPPHGETQTIYALRGSERGAVPFPQMIEGRSFELVDFEKAAEQHILSVQRDPGVSLLYVGFTLLIGSLLAVFMFSHQRVWVVVEDSGSGASVITAGGNTNRHPETFERRFARFLKGIGSEQV